MGAVERHQRHFDGCRAQVFLPRGPFVPARQASQAGRQAGRPLDPQKEGRKGKKKKEKERKKRPHIDRNSSTLHTYIPHTYIRSLRSVPGDGRRAVFPGDGLARGYGFWALRWWWVGHGGGWDACVTILSMLASGVVGVVVGGRGGGLRCVREL